MYLKDAVHPGNPLFSFVGKVVCAGREGREDAAEFPGGGRRSRDASPSRQCHGVTAGRECKTFAQL